MSTTIDHRYSSESSRSQEDIEHRPLAFEEQLFMSRVYGRSSKDAMIQKPLDAGISEGADTSNNCSTIN